MATQAPWATQDHGRLGALGAVPSGYQRVPARHTAIQGWGGWAGAPDFPAGVHQSSLGSAGSRVQDGCGLPHGGWLPTKEQDFKNTLRDKSAIPEHVIPADAPGVRELVDALLSIWPEFEWERLVLDPEPDYLRQGAHFPQPSGLESGRNAREFHTAV